MLKAGKLRNENLIFSLLRQVALIVVLSLALGNLVNQVRLTGSPGSGLASGDEVTADSGERLVISLEEAWALCSDTKALFLDARHDEGHNGMRLSAHEI